VIFDWGGTLTPWRSVDQRAGWQAYADVLHADDPSVAATAAAALAEADAAHWATVRDESRAFTLAHVLAAAGAGHDEAAWLAFRRHWEPATLTDPQAEPVLRGLRERGLRTGVLSSTAWPRDWHEEVLRRDGVLDLLDGCVWSSDLEWTKPHPDAFRAAMAAVGETDPAECVFVGDRPYDDITGAKRVGMRAVLIPHSDIPPAEQVPTDVHPDAVIQQLADLLPLIDGWA
jgi:HAD superfamily hydrolase (TIGR01509 family)